jgi:hypothetical protein
MKADNAAKIPEKLGLKSKGMPRNSRDLGDRSCSTRKPRSFI